MVDGAEILEEMAQNSCSSFIDSTGLGSFVHRWKASRPWQKKNGLQCFGLFRSRKHR